MQTPVALDPQFVDVKRLDHLPLVGAMLRELAVKDTLDALIPPPERNAVTVGECIEALVVTILMGEHALWPYTNNHVTSRKVTRDGRDR